MSKQAIGVVGLAVMGRNLALNIESRGHAVSVYNRSREKTDELIAEHPDKKLVPAFTLEEFVESLEKPRRILLMVKAGEGTDATIDALRPLLDKGDILIDGGNTHFTDTIRRNQDLAKSGLHFIGTGVSGGEEGALKGPSIMPGGQREAYDLVAPILTEIAAKAPDGEPCVAYMGPDGAGHFVKMVHNGIEYGDMQLIAESYDVLKHVARPVERRAGQGLYRVEQGRARQLPDRDHVEDLHEEGRGDRQGSGRCDPRSRRAEGHGQVDEPERARPRRAAAADHGSGVRARAVVAEGSARGREQGAERAGAEVRRRSRARSSNRCGARCI